MKKKRAVRTRNDVSSRKRKTVKRRRVSKRIKVPKTRNANTLTESEFFSKIRSSLRKAFRFWKPMQKALDLASRPSQSENRRLRKEFQCAHCMKWFPRTSVEVDHKDPCGSLRTYEDVVPFIQRLTVEDVNAYQILCKVDHKKKTKEDNLNRKNLKTK